MVKHTPKYTKGQKPGASTVSSRAESALEKVSSELSDARELVGQIGPDIAAALNSDKPLVRKGGATEVFDASELNIQARHQLIIRLRAQGMHQARIARAVGVTERTVYNVVKDWYAKYAERIKQEDMDQFVLMLADGYLEDIDKLSDVIDQASSRGFAPAIVGAIKARQDARQKYVDILVDFGFLRRRAVEIDVNHQNAGDQYNQVVVISPQDMKAASMAFLKQKRLARGQELDEDADDRLSTLVVASTSPDKSK